MTDTTTNQESTSQPTENSISTRLNKLGDEFKEWHVGSRPMLYQILADCLAIILEIKGNKAKEQELDILFAKLDKRPMPTTDVYLKVLKLVMPTHRQRSYKYAVVLRLAVKSNQDQHSFVRWIKKDGIEKTAAGNSRGSGTSQNYKEDGQQYILQKPISGKFKKPTSFPPKQGPVVCVGRINALLELEVFDYFPDQKVLNTIYSLAGKQDSHNTPSVEDNALKLAKERVANLDAMKKESSNREKKPTVQLSA